MGFMGRSLGLLQAPVVRREGSRLRRENRRHRDIKCGGGAETEGEARLWLLLTCSFSADVEVCAASEHITPMSLFQFECDDESSALQLRAANGCYLAQVRPWPSEQENP